MKNVLRAEKPETTYLTQDEFDELPAYTGGQAPRYEVGAQFKIPVGLYDGSLSTEDDWLLGEYFHDETIEQPGQLGIRWWRIVVCEKGDPERLKLLRRAKRIKADIEQLFTDVQSWNQNQRPDDEPPIDPDPFGDLAVWLKSLDQQIRTEEARYI